jgi:hypothetical protein
MGRDDFVFTIGYDGYTAIIDGAAQRRYRRMNLEQLLTDGQFRAALRRAEYDGDDAALHRVLDVYNDGSLRPVEDLDELRRLFGVFGVPDQVSKVERI